MGGRDMKGRDMGGRDIERGGVGGVVLRRIKVKNVR